MSNDNQSWFDALGKPVSNANKVAAHRLLVEYGYHVGNAELAVIFAARDIEHDNPEQAYKDVRALVGRNETMVLMVLATLTAPQEVPC